MGSFFCLQSIDFRFEILDLLHRLIWELELSSKIGVSPQSECWGLYPFLGAVKVLIAKKCPISNQITLG